MEQKHLEEINRLVSAYCAETGLIPRNHQLNLSISFIPVPTIVTVFEKYKIDEIDPQILDSEIMDYDAYKMLKEYLESINYYRPSASKILNSLPRIIGKKDPTVREVIYFDDTDFIWLKYRNLGVKGLQHIDNWLSTLGLKRLPAPPQ